MNRVTDLDRLYTLLPVIYRQRDAEQGFPLRALLRVISEQVNVVENDISQLYDNWFIETCQDWVVPYIGDLIGYRQVHEAGEPSAVTTQEKQQLNKILISRREVANTIRYRRRKGTLSLLEDLAFNVAGWPAKAVTFYNHLSQTQSLNSLHPERGRIADLRHGQSLDLLGSPFDQLAHVVDLRRPDSAHTVGLFNVLNVALFVWRLRAYPVTMTPAYCLEELNPSYYAFSVIGNQNQLFSRPTDGGTVSQRNSKVLDFFGPITRREFEDNLEAYYGEGRSLCIYLGPNRQPVPGHNIVAANLTHWQYRPRSDQIAVDPELGRIVFPDVQMVRRGVWVSYYYGGITELGGGEYERKISQPPPDQNPPLVIYRVGENEDSKRLNDALAKWEKDQPRRAIIEIAHSGVFTGQLNLDLAASQCLQIRAANHARPIIRLLDNQTNEPDSLNVSGQAGSCLTLDGLLITGRGVSYEGALSSITIRHCTLVPGWGLQHDCTPRRPAEASIEILNSKARLNIKHSIVGSILVMENAVKSEPVPFEISDSVLDATGTGRDALSGVNGMVANVALTIRRCTVIGQIRTHAIELAENTIFDGQVQVARRQQGCMRFCYISAKSRTPRRYECQPTLPTSDNPHPHLPLVFNSHRYGVASYCQLASNCPDAIKRGADDEGEMGVFHDLFEPQRLTNLRTRLNEYTLAGMDAGIILVN